MGDYDLGRPGVFCGGIHRRDIHPGPTPKAGSEKKTGNWESKVVECVRHAIAFLAIAQGQRQSSFCHDADGAYLVSTTICPYVFDSLG